MNEQRRLEPVEMFFHPFVVLGVSLTAGILYAALATWRYSGSGLTNQYVYMAPIVVPFVAFLLDRANELRNGWPVTFIVDGLVVGTAMMRVVSTLPYVSGHALFLTYAALRPGSMVTRVTATIVMLEVAYLKFFVWHDLVTPLTGITLGVIAALIAHRLSTPQQRERSVKY